MSLSKEVGENIIVFLLWLIEKKPIHGYGIISLLRKNGLPGRTSVIYPLLNKMKRQKLISMKTEGEGKRKKKVYFIQKKGKEVLKKARNRYKKSLIGRFFKEMVQ